MKSSRFIYKDENNYVNYLNEKLVGKTLKWHDDNNVPGEQDSSFRISEVRMTSDADALICIYDEKEVMQQMWPQAVVDELITTGQFVFNYSEPSEDDIYLMKITIPENPIPDVTEHKSIYTLAD